MKKGFLLCFSLMVILPNLFSYNVLGHRVIANVAYENLTDETKKKVDEVLGVKGIVYYASWADEIKSDKAYDYSYKWHFQNLKEGITKDELRLLMEHPKSEGEHLFYAIDSLSQVIKSEPDNDEALLFIVHLVGDLNQPLHLGRLEDLGGNRIFINWFHSEIKLHQLWDKQMVESQHYSYSEYSEYLMNKFSDNEELQNECLLDASWQSYLLASRIYAYDYTGSYSYKYLYEFSKELDMMLYRGGIQLAKLLNELY